MQQANLSEARSGNLKVFRVASHVYDQGILVAVWGSTIRNTFVSCSSGLCPKGFDSET